MIFYIINLDLFFNLSDEDKVFTNYEDFIKFMNSRMYPDENFNIQLADEIFKQAFEDQARLTVNDLSKLYVNGLKKIKDLIAFQEKRKNQIIIEREELVLQLKNEKLERENFVEIKKNKVNYFRMNIF